MFNKFLVATAILTASSSALAINSPAPYVGASVGIVNNSTNTYYQPSYRGIDANLSLGYGGIVTPSVYLAGEIFAIPGSFNISGSNGLKTTWGVGASILPGWYFSDRTMGYARIGVIESSFTGTKKVGGQLGLGMQTNVCQNWDLRGEYVWSKYGSVGGYASPNSDMFNIGLVYRFE